jgi:hypothetical protein
MMLRTLETEALLGRALIKGFGFLSIDGSPFPRAQQPPIKPQGYPKPCGGGGGPLDGYREIIEILWIKKPTISKQKNSITLNNHRGQAVG